MFRGFSLVFPRISESVFLNDWFLRQWHDCSLVTAYTLLDDYSLFSELFEKFGGVILEVCEPISGGICQVFGGNFNDNSMTCPGNIREFSRKIPGNVSENQLT